MRALWAQWFLTKLPWYLVCISHYIMSTMCMLPPACMLDQSDVWGYYDPSINNVNTPIPSFMENELLGCWFHNQPLTRGLRFMRRRNLPIAWALCAQRPLTNLPWYLICISNYVMSTLHSGMIPPPLCMLGPIMWDYFDSLIKKVEAMIPNLMREVIMLLIS